MFKSNVLCMSKVTHGKYNVRFRAYQKTLPLKENVHLFPSALCKINREHLKWEPIFFSFLQKSQVYSAFKRCFFRPIRNIQAAHGNESPPPESLVIHLLFSDIIHCIWSSFFQSFPVSSHSYSFEFDFKEKVPQESEPLFRKPV